MEHTNKVAINILRNEYSDYPRNAWHYDREYKMLVKAIEKKPNIYTVIEKMDFSTIAEGVELSFIRLEKSKSNDTKQMREQILFSVIQKFYEKVITD